jgi:hypothetical protein
VARPKKKVTKRRITLTISPELLEASKLYVFENGDSLSGLVEKLLTETVKSTGKTPDTEQ